MTIEEILQKLIADGERERERFERLASRTASAIIRNTPDEFTEIVRDAAYASGFQEGHPGEVEPAVEAGDTDGGGGLSDA